MRRRTTALALIVPAAVALSMAGPVSAGSAPTGADIVASHAVHLSSQPGAETARSTPAHRAAGSKGGLPKIKGEVGPGFTISINKDSVPAGKYKFIVEDMSSMHNFHLTGAGVDEKTGIDFVGKEVWKLRLREGTYHAQCDPHATSMNTELEVTA